MFQQKNAQEYERFYFIPAFSFCQITWRILNCFLLAALFLLVNFGSDSQYHHFVRLIYFLRTIAVHPVPSGVFVACRSLTSRNVSLARPVFEREFFGIHW